MSLNEVYITKIAKFLPNEPVTNEMMEDYLGRIQGKPSRSRSIVLRNNGIQRRFYAINKEGKVTHTNAEMTANAIRNLFDDPADLKKIDLISCGTSTPDQMIPSHGLMVHGLLPESRSMEVATSAGVCCSGMYAMRYAYMAVKSGEVHTAVTTGSERVSPVLRSTNYETEIEKLAELDANPYISFDKDFLRWMLSDGAGAFLLSDKKNEEGISLKIEWLEAFSYANTLETCMYMGGDKLKDGSFKGYMEFEPSEIYASSIMSIKQDVKLLGEHIINLGSETLKQIARRRKLDLSTIDYFLPHTSSKFFVGKFSARLKEIGIPVSDEKWFTNLSQVGNVGSGSIYLMMEDLFNSGKLKKGDKIMIVVPESARFSYVYGLLTVC